MRSRSHSAKPMRAPARIAKPALVRIDARIPAHVKESVVVAAGLQGRSQTDFLVAALAEAARQVIASHGIITLCLDDQKALAAALDEERPASAPKGFARLERAARDHARRVDSR